MSKQRMDLFLITLGYFTVMFLWVKHLGKTGSLGALGIFGSQLENNTLFLKTFVWSRIRVVFMGMWLAQWHMSLCSKDPTVVWNSWYIYVCICVLWVKSGGTVEHVCRVKRTGGSQAASGSGAWWLDPSAWDLEPLGGTAEFNRLLTLIQELSDPWWTIMLVV